MAKYELVQTGLGKETETDENGNYQIDIVIVIRPTDTFVPDFSKVITVVSNNEMTGTAVDLQRETEVNNFMNAINQ